MFDKQASFSLYPDIPSEERNHESLMEGRIRGCWCPRRPPVPASAIPSKPATAEIKAPALCQFQTDDTAANCLSLGRSRRRLPVVGKQFGQSGDGVRRDAREHVVEPGERLDAAPLTGRDEASQHGRRPLFEPWRNLKSINMSTLKGTNPKKSIPLV
jgi:hypothetical protein